MTVTQADRDAAADFYDGPVFRELAEGCRTGLIDDSDGLPYAFAKHREAAEQAAAEPEIDAAFEVSNDTLTGMTEAPIKRIEKHDDGSFTVVIDYWPDDAAAERERVLVEALEYLVSLGGGDCLDMARAALATIKETERS